MELTHILILAGAGLSAGFVAGLIGVGGGVIFAPVLFFYYQAVGIDAAVIAPLTIGTSLLCTFIASLASAWFQYLRGAVDTHVAVQVGLFSAVAIYLTTRFVTTQPWYDGTAFQIVFSVVLLVVVARMVLSRTGEAPEPPPGARSRPHAWGTLAGTGTVAGAVSAAAGVGGGVVLVPAYHNLLRTPMHRAVATSSATIVLISFAGTLNYALAGSPAGLPATAAGYVDAASAVLLALPAVLTARLGVWTAHRIDRRTLRMSFAAIAAVVALRVLWNALG